MCVLLDKERVEVLQVLVKVRLVRGQHLAQMLLQPHVIDVQYKLGHDLLRVGKHLFDQAVRHLAQRRYV